MKKHAALFVKTILVLTVLYSWSYCGKKDHGPSPAPPGNNTTGNPQDTTKKPNDTIPLKGWVVSTLAGSTAGGYVDDTGSKAKFTAPDDIVQDTKGDLYLGESANNCIRKVTTAGQVSTFAKDDPTNPGYQVGKIYFMTTDGAGNFYYPVNQLYVRKLTASASTIFAGSSTIAGYVDDQDVKARFRKLATIARDSKGNLYLPDINLSNSFVIRKITPSGLVSTLSLNDQSGLANPAPAVGSFFAITIDSADNLYYSGGSSNFIKKVDPQGNVTLLAGAIAKGFQDGKGAAAQFNSIISIDADKAGNIWVCDYSNHAIRKVAPDGTVSTIAGNGTPGYRDGAASQALFNYPWAMAIDKNGTMYIVEGANNAVRKLVYYP